MENQINKSFLLKVFILFYFFIYSILLSISFGVFWISRPFQYFDNANSRILCNNNIIFDIGSNYIFSLNEKFDDLNDTKVRKLCEYSIIQDYKNDYKTPENVNYRISTVTNQYSSWTGTSLLFMVFFLIGALFIEIVRKLIFLILLRRRNDDFFSFGKILYDFFSFLIK